MEQQIKDIEGNILNVGDIILIPKNSYLSKHIILGFTDRHMILSCFRRTLNTFSWIIVNNNVSQHEHKQYIYKCANTYKIGKIDEFPEKLRKFVKYNQLNSNENY